jgi:predicted nucleotidyltransferase
MERVSASAEVRQVLSVEQQRVMMRALEEEEAQREHVVVYLSGAHAYGFPSPDSDLDLKAIHVAKTAELVGLEVPPPTVDRAEIIDGVEIDYTSNEVGHALAGMLVGNGNFLERVLGRTIAHESPLLDELRPIVQRSLSRRVHRHYSGFAKNQLQLLEKEPTVKKLLYVLRTTLTGIHLLRVGELEADFTRLMDSYGLSNARELVEKKRNGERTAADSTLIDGWRAPIEQLFAALDRARDDSVLPEEPANREEIGRWLINERRVRFS